MKKVVNKGTFNKLQISSGPELNGLPYTKVHEDTNGSASWCTTTVINRLVTQYKNDVVAVLTFCGKSQ